VLSWWKNTQPENIKWKAIACIPPPKFDHQAMQRYPTSCIILVCPRWQGMSCVLWIWPAISRTRSTSRGTSCETRFGLFARGTLQAACWWELKQNKEFTLSIKHNIVISFHDSYFECQIPYLIDWAYWEITGHTGLKSRWISVVNFDFRKLQDLARIKAEQAECVFILCTKVPIAKFRFTLTRLELNDIKLATTIRVSSFAFQPDPAPLRARVRAQARMHAHHTLRTPHTNAHACATSIHKRFLRSPGVLIFLSWFAAPGLVRSQGNGCCHNLPWHVHKKVSYLGLSTFLKSTAWDTFSSCDICGKYQTSLSAGRQVRANESWQGYIYHNAADPGGWPWFQQKLNLSARALVILSQLDKFRQ
jgi:hypothetical protein